MLPARRWFSSSSAVAALASLLACGQPATAAPAAAPRVEELRLIVKYREGVEGRAQALRKTGSPAAASAESAVGDEAPRRAEILARRHRLSLRDGGGVGRRAQVLHASTLDRAALLRTLAADPEVEYVEEDRRMRRHAVPNDPLYGASAANNPAAGQWYLRSPDASLVAAANLEGAWAISQGSAGVVVAVIDTGVRPEHPDLVGKLLPGYDFIRDAATANDGDGRDGDASDPGDWITSAEHNATNGKFSGCGQPRALEPSSWHGTQMAGLVAAATGNGRGMAGAGRNVRILPLRVLGKCGGFTSDIADAIRWAAGIRVEGVPDNPYPAKVISLSLGGTSTTCSRTYQEAISDATARGTLVVSSAGNDGLAVGDPANCTNVLAVGGLDHDGYKASYSNLGHAVGLAAPSGNSDCVGRPCTYPILSTVDSGDQGPSGSTYTNGTSNRAAGTSYATPIVAGAAALIEAVRPGSTPAEILHFLKSGARAFPTGLAACSTPGTTSQARCGCTVGTCGAGMLDAGAALARAVDDGRPVAHLDAETTQADVGQSIRLMAGASRPLASHRVLWEIVEGSGIARLDANDADTVNLSATTQGLVLVKLTVSDPVSSAAASATAVIRFGEPSVSIRSADSGNTSGGGGGAFEPLWLAGLGGIVAELARRRRRERQASGLATGPAELEA